MTHLFCLLLVTQPYFETADRCTACHNNLTDEAGRDVSIASAWRASMMAHASRDPYWQASVRAETLDHPSASAAIEDECATCHMPMAQHTVHAGGGSMAVFENLPRTAPAPGIPALAADGVSCTTCHQAQPDGFGTEESFGGQFAWDQDTAWDERHVYGPYEVKDGRPEVMHSASAFLPEQAGHLGESELCATCHTLYTHTLDDNGDVVTEFPEQVPYLEWKHSDYADEERSCQSCHMPWLAEANISSVLGVARKNLSQHVFRGGNAFMLGLLNRHRGELAVTAPGSELDRARARTVDHLSTASATLDATTERTGDTLTTRVQIEALTGHKLPSAYPSRRVWLHVTITDGSGSVLLESGAVGEDGAAIVGNDNDEDATRFEPHYLRISKPEQVQIYETILARPDGSVTTGLLQASKYLKDNRLLPEGFDKTSAPDDIAVRGAAAEDDDFSDGGDQVTYEVDVAERTGPFRVRVDLRYQSIGFRWAQNISRHDTDEGARFVRMFDGASASSSVVLATATARSQ